MSLSSHNIVIPQNAQFVKEKSDVDFKVDIQFFNKQEISLWQKDIKEYKANDLFDLLQMILLSYQKKDIKLLKSLYIKSAQSRFDQVSKELKKKRLDFYANTKSAQLNYILKYDEGYIVDWITNDKKLLKHYIVKENNLFKVAPLKLDSSIKENKQLFYIDIYNRYRPFKVYMALVDKNQINIKKGKRVRLKFNLSSAGNQITLFNKATTPNGYISKIQLTDNLTQGYHKDLDKKEKYVELELDEGNFKNSGKTTLYAIETTYPIGRITSDLYETASKIVFNVD